MNASEQEELLSILKALTPLCPEVRFGQLVANLAFLARGPANESIWEVEDDELLAAAREHLETLRRRESVTA